MIPPIRFTQERFQVVRRSSNYDHWRRHNRPDEQKCTNSCNFDYLTIRPPINQSAVSLTTAEDAQSLQQGRIRYLHGLRRSDPENYGYSEINIQQCWRIFEKLNFNLQMTDAEQNSSSIHWHTNWTNSGAECFRPRYRMPHSCLPKLCYSQNALKTAARTMWHRT